MFSSTQKNIPCRHFARGTCRFGEQCLFSHTIKNLERNPTPCMYFAALGQCRFGAQCRYTHESKPIIPKTE